MSFFRISTLFVSTSLLGMLLGCASDRGATVSHGAHDGGDQANLASSIVLDIGLRGPCEIAPDRAFFEFDSHRLTGSAKENLDTVASCLTVGALDDQRILIEGFTDARGTERYNEELGLDRARAVATYLAKKGVAKERMDVASRGETAVSVADAGGMVLDRRVEISVSNQLGGFAQWDGNRNNSVDPGELNLGLTHVGTFLYWDRDSDGELDLSEFNDGLFIGWDSDQDGYIDRKEWDRGAIAWYPSGASYGDWSAWDLNGDGIIDRGESQRGIATTDLYTHWNGDGVGGIIPSDYAQGAYWLLDGDDNGRVDEIEFYEVRNAGWYWYRPIDSLEDGAAEVDRW